MTFFFFWFHFILFSFIKYCLNVLCACLLKIVPTTFSDKLKFFRYISETDFELLYLENVSEKCLRLFVIVVLTPDGMVDLYKII